MTVRLFGPVASGQWPDPMCLDMFYKNEFSSDSSGYLILKMSWDILYKNMASLLNDFFDDSSDILLEKMSLDILYKNMVSPLDEFYDDSSDVEAPTTHTCEQLIKEKLNYYWVIIMGSPCMNTVLLFLYILGRIESLITNITSIMSEV